MLKSFDCPRCGNKGLKIDINKGFKVITTGKPLREFPSNVICSVCKRVIKYDVVKEEEK